MHQALYFPMIFEACGEWEGGLLGSISLGLCKTPSIGMSRQLFCTPFEAPPPLWVLGWAFQTDAKMYLIASGQCVTRGGLDLGACVSLRVCALCVYLV